MPLHDWTLVDPPAFHDMHQSWMFTIKAALNAGLLPAGYYAHLERHFGKFESDVLTLSRPSPDQNGSPGWSGLGGKRWQGGGGRASAEGRGAAVGDAGEAVHHDDSAGWNGSFAANAITAGRVNELYANPLALGDEWPEVPLFLNEDTSIELPLAATYARAFDSIAPHDQDTLARSLPGTKASAGN